MSMVNNNNKLSLLAAIYMYIYIYIHVYISLGDSTCGQRALYQLGMTGIPIYNVSSHSLFSFN